MEEVEAYIEFLLSFGEVNKPKMPKFDLTAYTDNEYISAIKEVQTLFDGIDDFQLTIKHLKGD